MRKLKQLKNNQKSDNDLDFIKNAALNGDLEAVEIQKTVNDLNNEKARLWEEINAVQSQQRNSRQEKIQWYKFALSRIDRIRRIESEKFMLIHDVYKLERKKPVIYLESLKRKRKDEIALNRNNHE